MTGKSSAKKTKTSKTIKRGTSVRARPPRSSKPAATKPSARSVADDSAVELARREAQLDVINSIQQGLASRLDLQGIYRLVGDKVSEISGAEVVVINTWPPGDQTIRYEYIREQGKLLGTMERPASPLNIQARALLERGKTILWNTGMKKRLEKFGHKLPAGEMPLSVLIVPIRTGERINTSISLQSIKRERAFRESDVRLLETLASSMGMALENARLFDETQRLLKETEQRAAELSIINSVQEGLASKLDIQAVYELVGARIREIFNADTAYIATLEGEKREFHFPFYIDRGRRLEDASPLAGLCLCLVYGMCVGGVLGYLVRAWWG